MLLNKWVALVILLVLAFIVSRGEFGRAETISIQGTPTPLVVEVYTGPKDEFVDKVRAEAVTPYPYGYTWADSAHETGFDMEDRCEEPVVLCEKGWEE